MSPKAVAAIYWVTTGLFCALMAFSAFSYLTQPAMAKGFEHLGYPQYFRVELAIAKFAGVVALLAPVPARMKEWAYAGFAITLVSAVIAHSSVDGPSTATLPAVVSIFLIFSYVTYLGRPESSKLAFA